MSRGSQSLQRIMAIDTETVSVDLGNGLDGTRQELQFGCTSYRRWRKDHWTSPATTVFHTISEYIDQVEDQALPGKRLWVFAHNFGGFDWNVLGSIEPWLERGWTIETTILECPPFMVDLSKRVASGKKRSIRFIDSLNYMRAALKDIGESLGLPKMEDPGSDAPEAERIAYCHRDVQIVMEFIIALQKVIQDNDLGNFSITAASQAHEAWEHRFAPKYTSWNGKEEPECFPSRPVYHPLERAGYFAGRVETRYIGVLPDSPITLFDINSLFPTMMRDYEFPYRDRKMGDFMPDPQDLGKYLNTPHRAIIATVRLKVPEECPWYPFRTERVCFPTGEFEITLCTPELRRAYEHGHIVSVGAWQLYDTSDLFSRYVKELYDLRLKYKAEGNAIFEKIIKVGFLNSLYGRFGQRVPKWDDVDPTTPLYDKLASHKAILEQDGHGDGQFTFDSDGVRYRARVFGGVYSVSMPADRESAPSAFPAIAAHVTSYARMALLDGMEVAGQGNWYYADTDSLMVNDVGRARMVAAGMISDSELGLWKYEKEATEVEVKGCKDYVFGGKVKLKGVGINRPSTKQLGPNEYRMQVFTSTAGAVSKGHDGEQRIMTMVKHLTRRYTKGHVGMDGVVTPWHLVWGEPTPDGSENPTYSELCA